MRKFSGFVSFLAFTFIILTFSELSVAQKMDAVKRRIAEMRTSLPAAETRTPEVGPLLIDDFNLNSGILLSAAGWGAHSAGGTNSIAISSPGLTYANYPSSGIGNAVSMTTSGEDDNRTFGLQNSGSIYAALMVNVTASQTTGDYFFHLVDGPITGNLFKGRLFVKKDPATTNFAFGIQKSSTANAAYTGFTFTPGTTYLIVVKYTFVSGATNDTVDLIVNPTLPGAEPAPTMTAVLGTDADATDLRGVALRQGSAANAATVRADGIRVGTTWASVTSPFFSKAPLDMDGDGRTDYVILRDSNGATAGGFIDWYIQLNVSGVMYQQQWGEFNTTTEDIAAADYDGDGKTDIAVYRRAALSKFYIILSATSTLWSDQLGFFDDDPVPGDYNNDGKADLAVFRDSGINGTSNWYYRPDFFSDFVTLTLNASGSKAGGDYNGDGIYDPAVFHDAGGGVGQFTMLLSGGGGTVNVNLGTSTDFVAPGDYDGDGKTDPCVIRNVAGTFTWEFKRSIDGATVTDTWGVAATDLPTPGDYNGDGKWDYAVWREGAQSEFFIMTPVTRFIFTRPWGVTGDFPPATAIGVSNGI